MADFELTENGVWDLLTGMRLQPADEGQISGWFDLPNGNCLIQQFIVLEAGQLTYQRASAAIAYFGKQVLEAELALVEMSPQFGNNYLLPAVRLN
jgi:hypothetical protein